MHGRYVEIGETPNDAGIREVAKKTNIVIPAAYHSSTLIGVYNDPLKDISEELRSTIIISHAIEYIPSEMTTADNTGIPQSPTAKRELLTIPLEEIGTTYTKSDFEEDHFSYTVLGDLKKLFNVPSPTGTNILQEPDDTVSRTTCS